MNDDIHAGYLIIRALPRIIMDMGYCGHFSTELENEDYFKISSHGGFVFLRYMISLCEMYSMIQEKITSSFPPPPFIVILLAETPHPLTCQHNT